MYCDWPPTCDGSGAINCDCECDHCQEDINHVVDCDGCSKCDPDGQVEDTCVHHFVRAVAEGFEVCMVCTAGRVAVETV